MKSCDPALKPSQLFRMLLILIGDVASNRQQEPRTLSASQQPEGGFFQHKHWGWWTALHLWASSFRLRTGSEIKRNENIDGSLKKKDQMTINNTFRLTNLKKCSSCTAFLRCFHKEKTLKNIFETILRYFNHINENIQTWNHNHGSWETFLPCVQIKWKSRHYLLISSAPMLTLSSCCGSFPTHFSR